MSKLIAPFLALLVMAGACSAASDVIESPTSSSQGTSTTAAPVTTGLSPTAPSVITTTAPSTITTATTISPHARPDWLGTRRLPLREDEFGEVVPTPTELQQRQFLTLDLLPPPGDGTFRATISPIPEDVLARASWTEECPVGLDELSYLTMSHYGFDGEFHTGEMIVNAAVAEDIVWVFEQLHAARFPIEQMRVIAAEEIDLHPTGDWNDTTSFVCRPAVGSGSWSQHAFGLAIDINPFHNPYLKDDLVLPELASYYLDRELDEPGMIIEGDVVFQAFAEIGWPWGGNWTSLKDWMHFSQSGR